MWRFKIFPCWYQNVQRDSDINKFRESTTRSHSKEHGRPSDCLSMGFSVKGPSSPSLGMFLVNICKSHCVLPDAEWPWKQTGKLCGCMCRYRRGQSLVAILKCHPPCFVFLNKISNQSEACPSGKMDWPAGSQDLPVSNHSSTGVTRTWHHILLFGHGTQFLRIAASVSVLSI